MSTSAPTPPPQLAPLLEQLRNCLLAPYWRPELPAIALFDDEFFENYDYDMVGPKDRKRIRMAALAAGWRAKGSRGFFGPDRWALRLTRPAGVLGSNPLDRVMETPCSATELIMVTPTQFALWALERLGAEAAEPIRGLVRIHPANLPKIDDWVSDQNEAGIKTWRQIKAEVMEIQAATIEARRAKRRNAGKG